MPTIASKKAGITLCKIHDLYFNNRSGNSFSNLMWRMLQHGEFKDQLVVFHPVVNGSADGKHMTIGLVTAGKYGYINLNVEFCTEFGGKPFGYKEAVEQCNQLNEYLFGLTHDTSNILVTLSMIKPKILIEINEQNATSATVTSNMEIFDLLIVDRDDENYDDNPGINHWEKPEYYTLDKFAKGIEARGSVEGDDDYEAYNEAVILAVLQHDM